MADAEEEEEAIRLQHALEAQPLKEQLVSLVALASDQAAEREELQSAAEQGRAKIAQVDSETAALIRTLEQVRNETRTDLALRSRSEAERRPRTAERQRLADELQRVREALADAEADQVRAEAQLEALVEGSGTVVEAQRAGD